MNHVHRAIVFYLFLFVFLVSAPLVVLHTAGYRYSFKTGRIARVGALVLKSTPRGATITLNNHETQAETPASLELAADEYRVTVTKSGFHPWVKLLSVASQETTFAENIILWKNTEPTGLIDIAPLATTKDGRIAVAYDSLRGLTIYESTSSTLTPVRDLPVAGNEIKAALSPNEDATLVTYTDLRGRTQFFAMSIPEGTVFDTTFLAAFAFQELFWGEGAGALYGVSGEGLRSANLFTRRVDTIAQSGSPFLIRGIEIWSILETDRALLVKSQAGDVQHAPEPVAELPKGSYKILPAPDPYLLLHEMEHDRILLINLENPTEIIAELAGAQAVYQIDGNGTFGLLVWNAFELWRANANTHEQELLRRQSDPIQDAAWYPHGGYVAMASLDRVEMLELDSRGGRNTTLLAQFPNHRVRDLVISPDGSTLFITVTDGPEAGLYSLELQ